MSDLFHDQQAKARQQLIDDFQAEQAAASQPEPTPAPATPEPRPTYADPAIEFAAQQAAQAIRESGGSEHDQREAALAVAKKMQRESTGLAEAIDGLERTESDETSLRDEVRKLREQIEAKDAPLPDPSTVSTEFYMANYEAYQKQLGIRNRNRL